MKVLQDGFFVQFSHECFLGESGEIVGTDKAKVFVTQTEAQEAQKPLEQYAVLKVENCAKKDGTFEIRVRDLKTGSLRTMELPSMKLTGF